MPAEDLLCGCGYDADYSAPEGCSDECGECGEECGVESCSVIVCRDKVSLLSVTDCDPADPDAGQMDNFVLTTGELGVRFFSIDDTMLPTTNETVGDDGTCEIDESVTGRGKTGNSELCWMRQHKNKEVIHFVVDNCNRLRSYGWNGGYKLTSISETPGGADNNTCGITYTFTNTKKSGFVFVNYTALGFTSPDEFLNTLLA